MQTRQNGSGDVARLFGALGKLTLLAPIFYDRGKGVVTHKAERKGIER